METPILSAGSPKDMDLIQGLSSGTHGMIPVYNPMSTSNMALLARILTAAYMGLSRHQIFRS